MMIASGPEIQIFMLLKGGTHPDATNEKWMISWYHSFLTPLNMSFCPECSIFFQCSL
jgi:hypothetical protein